MLDLTPIDALRFDWAVLVAAEEAGASRARALGRRLKTKDGISAEAMTAQLLQALYIEG